MAEFTPASRQRIADAVRAVEGADLVRRVAGESQWWASDDSPLEVFELAADLAAGQEVNAHPVVWSGNANSSISGKKGKLTVDTSRTVRVRDALGTCTAKASTWVWCLPYWSATGHVWVVVNGIANSDPVVVAGKLDGSLAAGGSATMSVWALGTGQTNWLTQSSDSGQNVTVYAPAVLRSGSIASGKWVEALLVGGKHWVRWAEC